MAGNFDPLRRLQQIRTEFIDNLSHELRTPLTTVGLLADALELMSRVRRRQEIDASALRRDTYVAAVRMRLDTSQLPKPFQLNALGSREWNIGSEGYRWTVSP